MRPIHLKHTKETPEIILDKKQNVFSISGVSLPEDVKEFYAPIIDWFKEYFRSPNSKTSLRIRLIYFNSASSKMLFEIFQIFKKAHSNGNQVEIIWQYIVDDDEMGEAGEDFAILFGNLPFTIEGIEYKSE
ncbi:MAG: DUF1987 domain-containing protein [Bacteroidales bacterium]|nr:DUF1987 domain-containing protein [Bacteroidales bacterium]